MINFQVAGIDKKYFINFYHINHAKKGTWDHGMKQQQGTGCRLCEIIEDGKKVLSQTFCVLHHKDQFNYEKGRKFALEKLMGQTVYRYLFDSKGTRTDIWEQYHNRNK